MKIFRIEGKKVALSPILSDSNSVSLYTKWLSNPEVNKWIAHNGTVCTFEEEERWAKDTSKSLKFSIFSLINTAGLTVENGQLIGTATIHRQADSLNFSLGICIGDTSYHNLGLGTETVQLLLSHCFNELHAHRVILSLVRDNVKAYKCYKKAGFKVCGVEHEASWLNGSYHDIIYMEFLDRDYFSKYGEPAKATPVQLTEEDLDYLKI